MLKSQQKRKQNVFGVVFLFIESDSHDYKHMRGDLMIFLWIVIKKVLICIESNQSKQGLEQGRVKDTIHAFFQPYKQNLSDQTFFRLIMDFKGISQISSTLNKAYHSYTLKQIFSAKSQLTSKVLLLIDTITFEFQIQSIFIPFKHSFRYHLSQRKFRLFYFINNFSGFYITQFFVYWLEEIFFITLRLMKIENKHSIYNHKQQQMMRLINKTLKRFSSTPRRQNFFELNPIFPDQGQKDFDIYNTNYNHILSGKLAVSDESRYVKIKEKLRNQIYLSQIRQKSQDAEEGNYQIDEQTGFPIGVHEDFDTFLQNFKQEKKVGTNIIGQFEDLVTSLMQKFNKKSELELIKIFRINFANSKKAGFKEKIRSLLLNSAFLRFVKQRKNLGLENDSLNFHQIQKFMNSQNKTSKRERDSGAISADELEEIVFREALKEIDEKISKYEEQVQKKSLANGTYVPTYHPKFGEAIKSEYQTNERYDLNFPRGHLTQQTTNQKPYSPSQAQDRYIQTRINKLFFLKALNQIQSKQEINPQRLFTIQDLPIKIREKDKIINTLLYKYKEQDLLIEPDLSDIYNEIDIALKKVIVKVVPNYLENEHDNQKGLSSGASSDVKERILSKDVLLWQKLNVEEIFEPEYYDEQQVGKIKIEEKELANVSPSTTLELSLNKIPFNLYRHADLDNFSVFNKYRRKIFADYITDKTVDPQIEFKFFSLEQATTKLNKIKKPEEVPDRFYGHATRKSSEAQVYVTKGTGKVLINNQPLADYFGDVYHRAEALKPLIFTETAGTLDLQFTVVGGGIHSQSECLAIALTRALIVMNPKFESTLAAFGLVGTDDRRNEAKKLGLYTARVRPPYVRR